MKDFIVRLAEYFDGLPPAFKSFLVIIGIIFIFAAVFIAGKKTGEFNAAASFAKKVKEGRADAVKRSRAVLSGQMAEQIAPFLPGFPCNPADVRFVGKPVDFIAFPGAADGNTINEILLIEVKSGSSALSEREKEIRAAVESGHIRYVEYRIL